MGISESSPPSLSGKREDGCGGGIGRAPAPDALAIPAWRDRLTRHIERLRPFADDRLTRRSRREKHPVRDFLFQYYAFRPGQLLRWSPGPDVLLEGASQADLGWKEFVPADGGMVLLSSAFPARRLSLVRWTLNYLKATAARPPAYGCFGLHEWAMVYQTPEMRHDRTPLRLAQADVAAVVESEELCCTHFDAFRFFSDAARPRNRHQLSRQVTDQFDQRGCVHVTMDLYRYAFKLAPWIAGELLADAFLLAWRAREVDMRASPYDLAEHGLEPIRIETAAGKEEYAGCQRELAVAAIPIRDGLIHALRRIVS